ncbi:hypothetical protein KGF56_000282 [Candida oxycetoniae]|uniref:Uncharacterized protein n=1 Tax=Candida oxycetoniae TaxID=497107 RepID=A0AAI9T217_9ASCO|nr:uncharacterized protein KGF56_000282 [Candida oxycetoniae]KAI3406989.2 hypothetical protein KGF56_000282 [Candida oxycetoniae]
MSEERHRILEQKRQRLLELKRKRITQVGSLTDDSELLKKIDVATQTAPVCFASTSPKLSTKDSELNSEDALKAETFQVDVELRRFDKGVQVTGISEDNNNNDTNSKSNSCNLEREKPRVINKIEVSDSELSNALIESIKVINRLHITKTIELDPVKVESKTKLQFVSSKIILPLDRELQTFDISPHTASQILVGFQRPQQYEFFAILYQLQDQTLLPYHYLTCSSELTQLKFDIHQGNRIIGALKNGELVIWEIDDSALIQVPTLSTHSLFFSLGSEQSWFQHRSKIVLLEQLKVNVNNCLLSVSKDGVTNLWSTNLLSKPKFSQKLVKKDGIFRLCIEHGIYTGSKETIGDDIELGSKLLLAANDGKLYDEQMNEAHEAEGAGAGGAGAGAGLLVTAMVKLSHEFIVTSHLDWHLRIWKHGQTQPYKVIPTNYVINKIIKRPQNQYQFTTVGRFFGKYLVEFWNLSKKLYKPVITICEEEDEIKQIKFNGPMEMLIGKGREIQILKLNKDYVFDVEEDDLDKGFSKM